jgi:hypothetical protein
MIDRCDAFVREATASMEAVCRDTYYRLILEGGLQGSFRVAANIINDAVNRRVSRTPRGPRLPRKRRSSPTRSRTRSKAWPRATSPSGLPIFRTLTG